MAAKPIPEGSRNKTPCLIVADGAAAIAFYGNRASGDGIGVLDIEVQADRGPAKSRGAQRTVRRILVGEHGHRWYVATHIEDVSPEKIGRRARAMQAAGG